jgi:hypothetical protein
MGKNISKKKKIEERKRDDTDDDKRQKSIGIYIDQYYIPFPVGVPPSTTTRTTKKKKKNAPDHRDRRHHDRTKSLAKGTTENENDFVFGTHTHKGENKGVCVP